MGRMKLDHMGQRIASATMQVDHARAVIWNFACAGLSDTTTDVSLALPPAIWRADNHN